MGMWWSPVLLLMLASQASAASSVQTCTDDSSDKLSLLTVHTKIAKRSKQGVLKDDEDATNLKQEAGGIDTHKEEEQEEQEEGEGLASSSDQLVVQHRKAKAGFGERAAEFEMCLDKFPTFDWKSIKEKCEEVKEDDTKEWLEDGEPKQACIFISLIPPGLPDLDFPLTLGRIGLDLSMNVVTAFSTFGLNLILETLANWPEKLTKSIMKELKHGIDCSKACSFSATDFKEKHINKLANAMTNDKVKCEDAYITNPKSMCPVVGWPKLQGEESTKKRQKACLDHCENPNKKWFGKDTARKAVLAKIAFLQCACFTDVRCQIACAQVKLPGQLKKKGLKCKDADKK